MHDDEHRQRMTALARTVPSIRSKFNRANECGLDPWNPSKIAQCVHEWTSTEQQIVAFLLSVWNSQQELGGRFTMVDAITRWGDGDRKTLVDWALNPFAF